MTTPSIKEALADLIALCERNIYPQPDKPGSDWARVEAAKSALATLSQPTADRREIVARAICKSGRFETGQGTCAVLCMDQLGDVRKKGCGHCIRVHAKLADAILAALNLGRKFIGIERDPKYFEIAQRRLSVQELEAAE